jgi:uncharacterized protein (TIGR02246 family)
MTFKEVVAMKMQCLSAAALAVALVSIGCQQAPPPKPDLKAEAAKIMEADAAWMKAAQAKDAAAQASFFAEDGSALRDGYPKATGREAIQKLVEAVSKTEVSLSWATTKLVVSEAADMAYQEGTWESIVKNDKGEPAKEIGKFLTVWAKQKDGSWKVQSDCGNLDGPRQPVK